MLSLAVGALLATTPGAVHAAPATAQEPTPAEQAQALFKEGAAQYKMSNYPVSLDRFGAAFVLSLEIDDAALRVRVLHALQFNLARAHVKTYKLDKDLMHLRQAVDLLENYLEDDTDLGVDDEAHALMAEAKAELERRESAAPIAGPAAIEAQPGGGEADDITPVEAEASPGEVEGDRGPAKPGKALMLAGYGSLGMSAVGLGLMVGGIVMGKSAADDHATAGTKADIDDADRRGKLGNTLFIAGAATAGVFAAAGVTLVVLGKRASRRGGRSAARIWVSPSAGSALTGLQVGGRF